MPKSIYTCKQCNKIFESYPLAGHKPRQFCSDYCSKQSQRKYNDTTCPTCGKVFAPRLSRGGNKNPQIYCSIKCSQTININLIKISNCASCGKEFFIYKNKIRSGSKGIYCSKKCNDIGRRKPESYTVKNCLNCHKEFTISKLQIKYRNGGKYCSNKCRFEYCIGENHPVWKADKVIYDPGPNWHIQRHKALKRDKYTCQSCGNSHKDKVRIDVHHIIKCRLFNGDYEKANDLSNLITLCRKCHLPIEHGKMPCPMPIPHEKPPLSGA